MPNKDELEKDMEALTEKHGIWGWVLLRDTEIAPGSTTVSIDIGGDEERMGQLYAALEGALRLYSGDRTQPRTPGN